MLRSLTLVSLLLAVGLGFIACGDDPAGGGDATADSDVAADATTDGTAETSTDDTAADTSIDTAADTSIDTTADSSIDTADSSIDTTPDTTDTTDTTDDEATPVPTPRLELSGPSGPLSADATDDAGEQPAGTAFIRTYTITNSGDGPLTVIGVTLLKAPPLNCEQALTADPDAVVPPGETTTFDITTTVLDEGPANCPFVVASDDPDSPSLRVDIAATGTAPTPVVDKAATATCGATSGFGILLATLADFTADGTLVTTDTQIGDCWLTTQVGTLPGGTSVNNAADSATCGGLSCTESSELCRAIGGAPASAGASVTVTMTDTLLGGTVSHTFPKAPGTLTRQAIGGSVSRGAPLTFTTSGGVAGTLTLVTIQQDNSDGQTTVICEYPAESTSVTIPTNILGHFHDGAFNLLVDTRVQAFSEQNGYDVVLIVVNSSLPQQSSFTP